MKSISHTRSTLRIEILRRNIEMKVEILGEIHVENHHGFCTHVV